MARSKWCQNFLELTSSKNVEIIIYKQKSAFYIQGVPKVRFSNFMHSNFWSKLYFYMKFLEDVYFCTEYMYSEFQWLACAFWFFITFCSRCGVKWDTVCRPTDDPFWAFLSPGAQEPVHPQTIFVYFRQLKNILYVLGIHPKKIIIPASFHSKAFVLLYKFETSWALLGRLIKQRFFLPSQGPLIFNILNSFS